MAQIKDDGTVKRWDQTDAEFKPPIPNDSKEQLRKEFQDWYEQRIVLNFGIDSETTKTVATPQSIFNFFWKEIEKRDEWMRGSAQHVKNLDSQITELQKEIERLNNQLKLNI